METRATSDKKKKNLFAAKKNDELLRLRADAVELRIHLFLSSLLSAGESRMEGEPSCTRSNFERGRGEIEAPKLRSRQIEGKVMETSHKKTNNLSTSVFFFRFTSFFLLMKRQEWVRPTWRRLGREKGGCNWITVVQQRVERCSDRLSQLRLEQVKQTKKTTKKHTSTRPGRGGRRRA